jgi:pSer/pThr/pTyr-binding forkhead associated (FHA) protein
VDEWTSAIVGIISSVITAYVMLRVGLRQQEARFRQELELKITDLQQRESQWRRELSLKLAELRAGDATAAQSLAQQFAIGVVIVQDGAERTKIFVPPSSRITAGRNPSNEIVLNTRVASQKHFAIFSDAGAAYVEDLGSSNGVWINGEQVRGRRRLQTGDLISVGGDLSIEFQALP